MAVITKPGLHVFGAGPPAWLDNQTFFQNEDVVHVACGEEHFTVVSASGRVCTFQGAKPKLMTNLGNVKITQAACGCGFTVLLTDQGELYACGKNSEGQLGLGHRRTITSPVRVIGLPPVKKVVAGCDSTVVLTVRGEVWACGSNVDGKLGFGQTYRQSSFTKIPHLPELIRGVDISCGWGHTALIYAYQVLMITGCNCFGQLGLGWPTSESIYNFTPLLEPPSAVSCGAWHTVTLRVDGSVWAWGDNTFGQLGTGDVTKRFSPTQMMGLENHTITQVVAGFDHTALLTEEGDVLMCGRGVDGELGQGKKDLLVPTLLPKSPMLVVKQVAFAETYALMLVEQKPTIAPSSELQCGPSLQGDQASVKITNWEKSVLRSLQCPVCLKTMYAPIHMCLNGHNLCGSCRSNNTITVCPVCRRMFGNTRNIALESLSMEVELPCADCFVRLPTRELEKHSAVCPKRKDSCPLNQMMAL